MIQRSGNPLQQEEIAQLIGVKQPCVSRAMKKLFRVNNAMDFYIQSVEGGSIQQMPPNNSQFRFELILTQAVFLIPVTLASVALQRQRKITRALN